MKSRIGTIRDLARYRWSMMVIVSLLMAANYYFYDAFPNTFLLMAILGGIIADKLGIRPTGFLFAVFMLIGAFLTAYGASDIFR